MAKTFGYVTFAAVFGILVASAVGSFLDDSDLINYGRWCGWKRTAIAPWANPGACTCQDDTQTCIANFSPIDELDRVCAIHDFCSHCHGVAGTIYNTCSCDQALVTQTRQVTCTTQECETFRSFLLNFFSRWPCVCIKQGKVCRKYIFWGEAAYCNKMTTTCN